MGISFGQIAIIIFVIIVIFGAGRLPRLMEDLAKGMKAFKKGLAEDEKPELNQIDSVNKHPKKSVPVKKVIAVKEVSKRSKNSLNNLVESPSVNSRSKKSSIKDKASENLRSTQNSLSAKKSKAKSSATKKITKKTKI